MRRAPRLGLDFKNSTRERPRDRDSLSRYAASRAFSGSSAGANQLTQNSWSEFFTVEEALAGRKVWKGRRWAPDAILTEMERSPDG